MKFKNVEVIKTKENFFYLDWDLEQNDPAPIPPESIDDYKFQIYWARDPASGFLAVLDDSGNPVEIDGAIGPLSYTHRVKQYDFEQEQYYKIYAIQKIDPFVTLFSWIVFIGMYEDGIHETMRYAEDLLYSRYYGEPCVIIKRKSFGTRCPECWSPERQQRNKSHCETCDGSGFLAGFYQPISIQISFDSNPAKNDLQKEWENSYNTKRARLSNYPLVRPKDLIVNLDDNKRYVIAHVETTKLPKLSPSISVLSKQNYILSQLLTLEELNTDDNEYHIDIDNITAIPASDDGNTGGVQPSNYRYYGLNTNTTLTNDQILALNKELCVNKSNTHIYNCTAGGYIWICYPIRFGTATFTVNGFTTTFDLTIQTVTNEAAYTESYNCYRSLRLQHGSAITVAVS